MLICYRSGSTILQPPPRPSSTSSSHRSVSTPHHPHPNTHGSYIPSPLSPPPIRGEDQVKEKENVNENVNGETLSKTQLQTISLLVNEKAVLAAQVERFEGVESRELSLSLRLRSTPLFSTGFALPLPSSPCPMSHPHSPFLIRTLTPIPFRLVTKR